MYLPTAPSPTTTILRVFFCFSICLACVTCSNLYHCHQGTQFCLLFYVTIKNKENYQLKLGLFFIGSFACDVLIRINNGNLIMNQSFIYLYVTLVKN